MPGRASPKGIHVDSPLQRQWMSLLLIGNQCRIASTVVGAAASQLALKWRSPTRIDRSGMPGRIARGMTGTASGLDRRTEDNVADGQPTISTPVLDNGSGRPAASVVVTLYRIDPEDGKPGRMTHPMTDGNERG